MCVPRGFLFMCPILISYSASLLASVISLTVDTLISFACATYSKLRFFPCHQKTPYGWLLVIVSIQPKPSFCQVFFLVRFVLFAFHCFLLKVRYSAPSSGLKIVVISLLSLSSYCGSIIVTGQLNIFLSSKPSLSA